MFNLVCNTVSRTIGLCYHIATQWVSMALAIVQLICVPIVMMTVGMCTWLLWHVRISTYVAVGGDLDSDSRVSHRGGEVGARPLAVCCPRRDIGQNAGLEHAGT